ncbi:polysaccharide biosynthesis protein, partial [Bacillus cereus]|nr:polysaccharide biosynthesis protein [Bacillus cereus]
SGSVVPLFKQQIKKSSEVGITDANMTRFFLTVEDAVGLLFKAVSQGRGGEIFVMKMPACKITDLAEVLIEYSGKEKVKVKEVGIRPGEKLSEMLLSEVESKTSISFDQNYFVVLPTIPIEGLQEYYSSYPLVDVKSFSSQQDLLGKHEVKQMLLKGGFLR